MKGPEHLLIGMTSAGLVVWVVSSGGAPVGIGAALAGAAAAGLGSLAPDIDHPQSLIGKRIPLALLIIGLPMLFSSLALKSVSARGGMFAGFFSLAGQQAELLPKWGALLVAVAVTLIFVSIKATGSLKHRGPTHSLVALAGGTVASWLFCLVLGLAPWLGLLFGLGWLSHLLADATTPAGLPFLLWPGAQPEAAGSGKVLGLFLIPLLLFGATGWYFSTTAFVGPTAPARQQSVPTPVAAPVSADVPLALHRLTEAAPDIAAALTNEDSPVVEQRGVYTSYTWQYLRQATPNEVTVETITVSLDGSGQIVGVDRP